MYKKQIYSWFMLFLLVFSLFPSLYSAFTNNDMVVKADELVYENEYGRLTVFPPTSREIVWQRQIVNVTWYKPDNVIDVAFRFNNALLGGKVEYWNNDQWNTVNFNHVEYGGKHYYIHTGFNVEQDKTYNFRWQYRVPINSGGKWDLIAKLNSDTWLEAYQSGRYVLLDPWWNSLWGNRLQYSISSDYVDNDLNNLPILFVVNGTVSAKCDDGTSIRFFADDNVTELYYEIESWNDRGGDSFIWVNVTSISSSVSTNVNMYYNNVLAPVSAYRNSSHVWDSNYLSVLHMTDLNDSTGNYDWDNMNVATTNESGKVGGCYDFDGDDQYLRNKTFLDTYATNNLTVELWCNRNSLINDDNQNTMWSKFNTGTDYIFGCPRNDNQTMHYTVTSDDDVNRHYSTQDILNTTGIWHYTAIAFANGSQGTSFVNDSALTDGDVLVIPGDGDSKDFEIGRYGWNSASEFDGSLDEFRVSQVKRNNSWLLATYHSMNQTTGFITPGTEEFFSDTILAPSSLWANTSSTSQINLAWITGVNSTHTYIERYSSGYGWSLGTGTEIYNNTGTNFSETGLSQGITYYYQAWGYNSTVNNYSINIANANNLTGPDGPTSGIGFVVNSTSINISWVKGTVGVDSTVVIRKSGSYPTSSSDGTNIYNDTGIYYLDTSLVSNMFYTLYSYNSTINCFSSGFNVEYGCLIVNVHDENTSDAITNWSIFISHEDGSETYESMTNNNSLILDTSVLPYGDNIHVYLNATGYEPKLFVMDIVLNTAYTLNAYLSEITSTDIYIFTVVGPQTEYGYEPPIEHATIYFKRYINDSVGYQHVGIRITGATGIISERLMPMENYLITVTKSGYDTEYMVFQPPIIKYAEDRYHTIRLIPTVIEIPFEWDDFWDTITFRGVMTSPGYPQLGNITLIYIDSNSSTTDTQIRLYESYNGTITLINVDSRSSSSFSFTVGNINTSRLHYAVLWFNNSAEFDVSSPVTITIYPISIHTSRTPFDLDDRITSIVGPAPLGGWADIIAISLPLIFLISFGPSNTGVGILGCGLCLGLIQGIYAMTFTNVFNVGLTAMAVLVVVVAILYIWTKKAETESL